MRIAGKRCGGSSSRETELPLGLCFHQNDARNERDPMSKQLVLAVFVDETAADEAVKQLKAWEKTRPDADLGAIGVMVKDDKGKIKTHKLGARRTAGGAVLFAVAALLTGGMSVLGGALLGGIVGAFFRKGLGIPKDKMAELGRELDGGRAAVGLLVNPEQVGSVCGMLTELGGKPEAHELADEAVEQAVADAAVAPEEAAPEPAAPVAGAAAASAAAEAAAAEQVKLAAEAFIYGYPLVYNMKEMAKFPAGPNLAQSEPLPYNMMGYARRLLGPEAHFVSPNNDTLYLIAICDVRAGPVALHTPDTAGRYYVLQFVDAWTNNFAYIGRRATGTAEARYLLTAPDYTGPIPDGMRAVCAPTGIFAIVGRIAVNGEADLPVAHALQDQFTLTPLGDEPQAAAGVPQPDPRVPAELQWWEACRVALRAFPPPAVDAPFLAICEKLGLTAAESPYVNADPALAGVLVAGQQAAQNKIEELIKAAARPVNGWQDTKHLFDYNADFFEIGALNDPEWIIADRKTAYVTRAVVARAGLWGNHGYEAVYEIVYVDADNQPLDSDHRYELALPQTPPVDAFWSLTMYDVPEFYLVANAINRYAIGDRTPGLQYGPDGSLTIYLQKDAPEGDKAANWLPTPQAGPFRPIMRMYQPRQAILDGHYILPAIKRVS